jgi:hypothetical protein
MIAENKTQDLREEMRAAVKQFKCTSSHDNKDGKVEYLRSLFQQRSWNLKA